MHETLCFSIQSPSPNKELVKERVSERKSSSGKELVKERVSERKS